MIDGLLLASSLGLTVWTAGHALLNKHSAAAAWGWIVTCLLLPFAGPALYWLFGINRVRTRARRQQQAMSRPGLSRADQGVRNRPDAVPTALEEVARSGDVITGLPLVAGNRLLMLHDGEQAYPRMLAAIDGARHSVALMSYIFDLDAAERKRRIDQLFDMIGLQHARRRKVGEFSKGMARRIGLAQALVNDPDLVILDEPTSGLEIGRAHV